MEKKRGIGLIFALSLVILSLSFVFAESIVSYSEVSFSTQSVTSSFDWNTVIIVVAAVLLIVGALLLRKKKKIAKVSKKKKL